MIGEFYPHEVLIVIPDDGLGLEGSGRLYGALRGRDYKQGRSGIRDGLITVTLCFRSPDEADAVALAAGGERLRKLQS